MLCAELESLFFVNAWRSQKETFYWLRISSLASGQKFPTGISYAKTGLSGHPFVFFVALTVWELRSIWFISFLLLLLLREFVLPCTLAGLYGALLSGGSLLSLAGHLEKRAFSAAQKEHYELSVYPSRVKLNLLSFHEYKLGCPSGRTGGRSGSHVLKQILFYTKNAKQS